MRDRLTALTLGPMVCIPKQTAVVLVALVVLLAVTATLGFTNSRPVRDGQQMGERIIWCIKTSPNPSSC